MGTKFIFSIFFQDKILKFYYVYTVSFSHILFHRYIGDCYVNDVTETRLLTFPPCPLFHLCVPLSHFRII